MYKDDGLSRQDIETLVATFGNQALDFFGALRASTYDAQIREWMQEVAGEHGVWFGAAGVVRAHLCDGCVCLLVLPPGSLHVLLYYTSPHHHTKLLPPPPSKHKQVPRWMLRTSLV
jgi:hypothetical protein